MREWRERQTEIEGKRGREREGEKEREGEGKIETERKNRERGGGVIVNFYFSMEIRARLIALLVQVIGETTARRESIHLFGKSSISPCTGYRNAS